MFLFKLQKIISISFLFLIIGCTIAFHVFSDNMSFNQIQIYIKGFGIWAPLVFSVIYVVATIFIPSTPLMITAGIIFGFKYGLLYTIISGFISSLLVFKASRKLGKEKMDIILEHRYLKYVNKYNQRLGNGGFWDLFVLRALPVMPFNVLNILMGMSKIKTGEYVVGTLIGLIPSNILAVYFGSIIGKIF